MNSIKMFLKITVRLTLFLYITLSVAVSAYSKETKKHIIHNKDDIKTLTKELDAQFIKLSGDIYSKIENKQSNTNIKNIKQLHNLITDYVAKNNHFKAIQLINKNHKIIKESIDSPYTFSFIKLLLQHNEWNTANKVYNLIKREGDKSLISNAKFILAKYFFTKKQFKKTRELLDGIFSDLSEEDSNYAFIINGIALQNIKKHREALKYYSKVPSRSKYYKYAKLNTAIVYIRQGWWSDAHIIIKTLLNKNLTPLEIEDEFKNRLHLVLGYSFLQQEYFREARESFRNIQKRSQYANRAMLGIALAAASQGDQIGSLNILNLLQQKDPNDLPVEETYLLLPYVYEKLGQYKTASASYSIGLTHYQEKISQINSTIRRIKKTGIKNNLTRNIKTNELVIDGNTSILNKSYPAYLIRNIKELSIFNNHINNGSLKKNIANLTHQYNNLLSKITINTLNRRATYLSSYHNQSQYGLARLYDNSKKNK